MKLCKRCGYTLPTDYFNRNRSKPDGLQSNCRTCHREQVKIYDSNNKEAKRKRDSKFWLENPEANRAKFKKWYEQNKARHNNASAMRRTWLKQQGLLWKEEKLVNAIYMFRDFLTESLGVKHHCDHIIPLKHQSCSGLHTASNLSILRAKDNSAKRNRSSRSHIAAVADPLFWRYTKLQKIDTGCYTSDNFNYLRSLYEGNRNISN